MNWVVIVTTDVFISAAWFWAGYTTARRRARLDGGGDGA